MGLVDADCGWWAVAGRLAASGLGRSVKRRTGHGCIGGAVGGARLRGGHPAGGAERVRAIGGIIAAAPAAASLRAAESAHRCTPARRFSRPRTARYSRTAPWSGPWGPAIHVQS